MVLLSYFLFATLGLVLIPYLNKEMRYNRCGALRSLSGLICQVKPYGHFLMSLGNLLIFLILSLDNQKAIAWFHWVFLQLVLSFDVDDHEWWHFFFLTCYIAMVLTYWARCCAKYDLWWDGVPVFVTSGLFSLIFLYNQYKYYYFNQLPYHTLQSLVELAWIISNVVLAYKFESYLLSNQGVKSHTLLYWD